MKSKSRAEAQSFGSVNIWSISLIFLGEIWSVPPRSAQNIFDHKNALIIKQSDKNVKNRWGESNFFQKKVEREWFFLFTNFFPTNFVPLHSPPPSVAEGKN